MSVSHTAKTTKEKSLTTAYLELHRLGQNGDYDRALKTANKILNIDPQQEKAFHCKIVCLIQQSKFNEVIQCMQKNPALSKNFHFEKAYCLYRQNYALEALKVLEEIKEINLDVKELKAQILYRLEQFNEALEIYQDIIKNSDDEYADERHTNLGAVIAQLNDEQSSKELYNFQSNSYEVCYNWACFLIAQKQFNEAENKLKISEKLCRELLEEDGVSEEEIEIELALIRIQMACVYQMQGRIKEAQQLYVQTLKLKLDDITLVAVANNNIIVINKDQNVFDSKKKMKVATNEALIHKLSSRQRMYIALNNAIFMYYTNNFQLCNKMCKSIEETWPNLALQARITKAISLVKLENINEALQLLNEYVPKTKEEKLSVKLASVHLLLIQGDQIQACKILENMDEETYKPAIVGALITLYLGMKKTDTALKVFERTVDWYQKNKVKEANLCNMWKQAADFHMRNGQAKVAADSLEELIRINPNDKKAVAQFALASLQFDKNKAEQAIIKLPPLDMKLSEQELDALENTSRPSLKKSIHKNEQSPGVKTEIISDKKRKNRKSKRKLPKNCDLSIPPDLERWLPKYERTGYRKKRDRRVKEIIKGSQGTTSAQVNQFDFSKMTEQELCNSPASSVEPSPQPKNQQKKVQQKKKNKRR